MREVLTAMIKAHEIQGCLALENAFNKVGLDHVILVKLASTAVVCGLLGLARAQISLLGFPIGALPAGGTEIPTFLSCTLERRLCRQPQEFGRGAIEGVAGPEAANNAAAAGILVPLLTLGLPSTATAAVLLAAFQNYGLQPGPMLFSTDPALVWGLIASLYIGNLILLVLNLPLVGIWVRLLLPRPYIYGAIIVFALVAVWGQSTSWVDLALMCGLGLVGDAARVHDFPIAPALIGLILGPQAEIQLRRALALSQGDWAALAGTPVAATLLAAACVVLLAPALLAWRGRRKPG